MEDFYTGFDTLMQLPHEQQIPALDLPSEASIRRIRAQPYAPPTNPNAYRNSPRLPTCPSPPAKSSTEDKQHCKGQACGPGFRPCPQGFNCMGGSKCCPAGPNVKRMMSSYPSATVYAYASLPQKGIVRLLDLYISNTSVLALKRFTKRSSR